MRLSRPGVLLSLSHNWAGCDDEAQRLPHHLPATCYLYLAKCLALKPCCSLIPLGRCRLGVSSRIICFLASSRRALGLPHHELASVCLAPLPVSLDIFRELDRVGSVRRFTGGQLLPTMLALNTDCHHGEAPTSEMTVSIRLACIIVRLPRTNFTWKCNLWLAFLACLRAVDVHLVCLINVPALPRITCRFHLTWRG